MIHLVTDGAGFIGSHIAEAILRRGDEVRILDDPSAGKRANVPKGAELIVGKVQDPPEHIFAGVDTVFHQAALPSVPRSIEAPTETHEATATGTLQILKAAQRAGVRRVVYAGSSSAYGGLGDQQREGDTTRTLSPYAAAKLCGECYCQAFYRSYGLETVVLRYFNVFGPRQDPESPYAAVIPKFITAILAGNQPTIYGDGFTSRDFTPVANIVEANLLAMEAERAPGEVFNVAMGGSVHLRALVELINEALGTEAEPMFLDERPGDVKHSAANIAKAKHLLRYRPVESVRVGLRRTIKFLKG